MSTRRRVPPGIRFCLARARSIKPIGAASTPPWGPSYWKITMGRSPHEKCWSVVEFSRDNPLEMEVDAGKDHHGSVHGYVWLLEGNEGCIKELLNQQQPVKKTGLNHPLYSIIGWFPIKKGGLVKIIYHARIKNGWGCKSIGTLF